MARADFGDTYVFVGPSLAAEAIMQQLPGAAVMPPVACGDVYRLVAQVRPRRIAIIDGYFERMAAVWHKEILFALEAGTEVWGAASMGALRAAELEPFGMRGVGRVFAHYRAAARAGRLSDDDEVAILHGPAERGYAAMSVALVDLRFALAGAVRAGSITAADEARLLARARARPYRDRDWPSTLADAAALRLPRAARTALAALAASAPSQKAADARALVSRLVRTPVTRRRPPSWRLARTWFWDRLTEIADES
ncbi:MAG: TfuA domain-containing protein [Deltaproteobacteria bacterium]|nr:TfuA domain-containing protein [Deltaproteobacteria bacterium]